MNRDYESDQEGAKAAEEGGLLHHARQSYEWAALVEEEAPADPYELFLLWFKAAEEHEGIKEANAMALATADEAGRPSARTVLLKEYSAEGFVFYSNYESRKGREIAANPYGALLFWWPPLERQIRLEGRIDKIARDRSDAYFKARPKGSQMAATVSNQSCPVSGRNELEEKFTALEKASGGEALPRPENWGGYILKPALYEFWQGRPNRLHDRLAYKLFGEKWGMQRLAP